MAAKNFTVSFTGNFFVTISASQRTTFVGIFSLMKLNFIKDACAYDIIKRVPTFCKKYFLRIFRMLKERIQTIVLNVSIATLM